MSTPIDSHGISRNTDGAPASDYVLDPIIAKFMRDRLCILKAHDNLNAAADHVTNREATARARSRISVKTDLPPIRKFRPGYLSKERMSFSSSILE